MKKLWLLICINLFLISPCFAQIDIHLENYYKLQESAVQLIIQFTDKEDVVGVCSGIIITEDEKLTGILTAKHCVPPNIKRIIINHKYIVTRVVKADDIDVAYVEISTSLSRYNPIYISQFNAKKKDYVYFLGYPSRSRMFEIGIVYLSGIKNQYIVMNSINGCSGSGVVNQKGELVGILWGGGEINLFNQKLKMVVITPIKDIKPFLIKLKIWNKLRFE